MKSSQWKEKFNRADRQATAYQKSYLKPESSIESEEMKTYPLTIHRLSTDYPLKFCAQNHSNASLLAESLELIQQTSGVLFAALQPSSAEPAEMPDAELAKVA
jgi:hypothetical protein